MNKQKLISVKKGQKETYLLYFELGNHQEFSIDEDCNLSSFGDYGTYSYGFWNPSSIGKPSFKHFLVGLNKYYVLTKLATEDSYNATEHIKACREEILRYRRDTSWTRKEARDAWNWVIDCGFEEYGATDLKIVQHEVYNTFPVSDYDVWDSYFMPEAVYSHQTNRFADIAFDAFQEVLREELLCN